jgi:arylsulfatase A-like enzyme
VHTPYDQAPGDPTSSVYRGLVWRADVYMGALVSLLKQRQMWETTLIFYSADNVRMPVPPPDFTCRCFLTTI